jgi:phytol kinase
LTSFELNLFGDNMVFPALLRWVGNRPSVTAWLVTIAGSSSYVLACSFVGKRRLLPPRLSRKLMHLGAGPLFALCWPLYPSNCALLAASVPLLASIQFALVGTGVLPDFIGLTRGATRSGRREELLQGPLLYGIVHSAIAATNFCRPGALLAIAALCGGDGLAEVVGKGVTSPALFWNERKTTAGSMACFCGSIVFGLALLGHFSSVGALQSYSNSTSTAGFLNHVNVPAILACALIGTAVESMPLGKLESVGVDNITVPAAVLLAASIAKI